MIPISADELARWRSEIALGVEHRDKEFGTYRQASAGQEPTTTLAGCNLDDYEEGARSEASGRLLNLVFPIVKIIVPTLFYQHPRVTAIPDRRHDEAAEDAFYVSELLNHDLRDIDFRFKETSQRAVFDSFVLGFGVVKIGYATEFGPDILPDDTERKKQLRERLKEQVDRAMVAVGLKPAPPPAEEEPEPVGMDATIQRESAYLQWISPFDFVVDPRARDLTDARWVAQRIRRTLAEIKRDTRYGAVKKELEPAGVEDDRIPPTFIEEFETADIWEVHYKSPDSPTGIRQLTFASAQEQTKAFLHEDNDYDLQGWQYEWLTPNKHGHRLYPISTLSVIRPLIDRVNNTLLAVLEQLDKFQAKVAHNDRITGEALDVLQSSALGATVKVDGQEDVRSAVAVISMDQVNGDLMNFVKQLTDLILVVVGVTQAQFTGISTAQTATEAQIGQGGQNIRRTDESNTVGDWANRVVAKLWRVKAQFQDFTEVDLVQDAGVPNPQTGISRTAWYPPIDEARADRLKRNRFNLHLEVGSIQKPSLEVIRAQFEQFVRALMEPVVQQGLAMEGKRLSAEQVIRYWTRFFSEYGLQGLERIIVPVQDESQRQALLGYGEPQQGQQPQGNGRLTGSVPTPADLMSAAAGEKGQGMGPMA